MFRGRTRETGDLSPSQASQPRAHLAQPEAPASAAPPLPGSPAPSWLPGPAPAPLGRKRGAARRVRRRRGACGACAEVTGLGACAQDAERGVAAPFRTAGSGIRVFGPAGDSVYKHSRRPRARGPLASRRGRRSGVSGVTGRKANPCPSLRPPAVSPRVQRLRPDRRYRGGGAPRGAHVVRAAASPPPRRPLAAARCACALLGGASFLPVWAALGHPVQGRKRGTTFKAGAARLHPGARMAHVCKTVHTP